MRTPAFLLSPLLFLAALVFAAPVPGSNFLTREVAPRGVNLMRKPPRTPVKHFPPTPTVEFTVIVHSLSSGLKRGSKLSLSLHLLSTGPATYEVATLGPFHKWIAYTQRQPGCVAEGYSATDVVFYYLTKRPTT